MFESFTAGAHRALERARARARRRGVQTAEPMDLLAALADEPESRGAVLLAEYGLLAETLLEALAEQPWNDPIPPADDLQNLLPLSPELRAVLDHAMYQARSIDRSRSVGTEHLVGGLLSATGPVAEILNSAGLAVEDLQSQLEERVESETTPIPLSEDIPPLELVGPSEAVDLGRILDASGNRAREGLRVVEDYVRFALDDPGLTRRIKQVRHRLGEALRGLDLETLVGSRDTTGDVGTHIMTASERVRENPRAVLSANFKRTAEALRSLEEYAKLVDVWLSGRFEVLRYDVYTLEKLTLTALASHRSMDEARVYLLIGGLPTLGDLTWIVGEALAGGIRAIQLREKGLPDREILRRAREVRILTAQAKARFFLNDRPDLARLAGADGVHVGQDDMVPRDARRILGPQGIIGVSTHHRSQIEQAILDGAGYLGVGPVFTSPTKEFESMAGLAFVRQAAEMTTLPWFAIGGIHDGNLEDVLEAGAKRIAVHSAIVHAERPRMAAKALCERLDTLG